MEDVLALYEKPYNPHEPVVCLDENPVVLRAEVRHRSVLLPLRPTGFAPAERNTVLLNRTVPGGGPD
jgi:hypothetical protein